LRLVPGFLLKRVELCLYDFLYPGEIPPVEARLEVEHRVLDRTSPDRDLIAQAQGAILASERFERGERCFVALHRGRPVSYIWGARGSVGVEEIAMAVRPDPSEAYLYDAFTQPAWRGKNLYPAVLRRALEHGRGLGLRRSMIFVGADNTASRRGVEKAGFTLFQTLNYTRFLFVFGWPELSPPLAGHPPAAFVSLA